MDEAVIYCIIKLLHVSYFKMKILFAQVIISCSLVKSAEIYRIDESIEILEDESIEIEPKESSPDKNVLNLFMIGDWGGPHAENGGPAQDEYGFSIGNGMNELSKKMNLDGILLLGDNIYNEGVDDVFDERWETTYQATFNGTNLKTTKMYATSGNHEYFKNVSAMIEYTQYDPTRRWTYPDYWYNVKFLDGRVELLMIDTSALLGHYAWENYPENRKPTDLEERQWIQYQWIQEKLKNSTAEILLVGAHCQR